VAEKREQGDRQLAEQQAQVRSDLQAQLPDLSRALAERILGRSLSDDDRHRTTVDEYVRGLPDARQGSETVSSGTQNSMTESR